MCTQARHRPSFLLGAPQISREETFGPAIPLFKVSVWPLLCAVPVTSLKTPEEYYTSFCWVSAPMSLAPAPGSDVQGIKLEIHSHPPPTSGVDALQFETEEEAIKLANDTEYGLASYYFTTVRPLLLWQSCLLPPRRHPRNVGISEILRSYLGGRCVSRHVTCSALGLGRGCEHIPMMALFNPGLQSFDPQVVPMLTSRQ